MVIPDTVTAIDGDAAPFRSNLLITSVSIPGTMSLVPENAFEGCANLKKAVLKDGVTGIGSYAFKDCQNLKTVEIPSSVTKIGAKVFGGCPKVVIACKKGSAAEKYAQKNNLQLTYL